MIDSYQHSANGKKQRCDFTKSDIGNEKIAEIGTSTRSRRLDPYTELLQRIENRTGRVGIIGLSHAGLPLAFAFCRSGFPVLGFDRDIVEAAQPSQRRGCEDRTSDNGLREEDSDRFEVTNDFGRLDAVDVVLICVPTTLTKTWEPDLSSVIDSVTAVGVRSLRGKLVIMESAAYPGTTRNIVLPILEKGGLRVGQDFFLAFSPQRQDLGNSSFTIQDIPKVVSGVEPRSLELAAKFYAQSLAQVVPVSSPEVAEACEVLENTYHAVNIALVNELKVLYDRMDINIWEVIETAKTKPFGFQPFYPGPGSGGHGISVDPFSVSWISRKYGLRTRFVQLAGEINTAMPAYVVGRIGDALNERGKAIRGSNITMLGMAYKKDVDDTLKSPGLELMTHLLRKGALVDYNDPYIPQLPQTQYHPALCLRSQELTPEYLRSRDCVVIVTDHSIYDWGQIVRHAPLVVDTRNATRNIPDPQGRVVRA